ncbi:hypothetical protein PUN28_002023 [Cardiocondyla obscurior]|uniref:Uncharacterized protein n=1 Tax=Cardiocondyla obscurior TaxID=286306 RepID=A0AAW2GSG4_9HYME
MFSTFHINSEQIVLKILYYCLGSETFTRNAIPRVVNRLSVSLDTVISVFFFFFFSFCHKIDYESGHLHCGSSRSLSDKNKSGTDSTLIVAPRPFPGESINSAAANWQRA